MTQVCTSCHVDKAIDQFWRRTDSAKGRTRRCKDCCRAEKNAYRALHRDEYRARNRKWWHDLRMQVLSAYGGACSCCGETMPEFLALDHVHGGGNAQRSIIGTGGVYCDARDRGFPDDYQLLCHNCNQSKGYYGYCPHTRRTTSIGDSHGDCAVEIGRDVSEGNASSYTLISR